MARKRETAGTPADPTLPKTPVEIGGVTYQLCFDLGALAEAEAELLRQGHEVNLLRALPVLNLSSVREIFPCALKKFHPELAFEHAQALVTLRSVYTIAGAILAAWEAANAEPSPDPPEA